MAYIGADPANKGIGLFSQDTFTGDGSTTTFDLTNIVPDGGGNDIQVFVDNVRQQFGSSAAYTVGFDGSSVFKRITFTTAPASGQSIYVLNPGTRNVQQIGQVSDNTITTAKLQDNAVTVAKLTSAVDLSSNTVTLPNLSVAGGKIAADAIDATKIADDAISEEHLDNTAITSQTELAATAAGDDVLLVFDTSASAIKKIQASNINSSPTITAISPTNANTGDGTGNHTFTVTGTNFLTGVAANFINTSGTEVAFDSVTRNSATQLTCVIAKSSLPNSGEPYDIEVRNSNGQAAKLKNQVNINAQPTFVTAAGSLGTLLESTAGRFTVVAVDPESAGNVTFEKQSGVIPPGMTLSNEGSEGGTAVISGTPNTVSAHTTFNFVLRAIDAASNTTSRAFSITINNNPVSQSFTSSGTFTVPSGVTNLTGVLVVAAGGGGGGGHPGNASGGGGGAGGLIFMPCVPVTAGGTITMTVGCGGAAGGGSAKGTTGQDSIFGASPSPGTTQTLTAQGGGGAGGGNNSVANSGGSGGGGSGGSPSPGVCSNGHGAGTQPTAPGNSGAYGFGNRGGGRSDAPTTGRGGGGGGAGAVGTCGGAGPAGTRGSSGNGGAGKAYTIADGTTSVFYAGGGGAGSATSGQIGGGTSQGGGGAGGGLTSPYPGNAGGTAGQANKGGGGGGGASPGNGGFAGGKGIIVIRY